MSAVTVGTFSLQECPGCDGLWLDRDAFERLCAERASQAAVLAHREHGTPARPARPPGPIRYRRCPRCGKFMNRVNFARHSGVVLDVCRDHGLFFDRGELHDLVAFIQGGGLDRARAREQERLADQRRELVALQSAAATGRRLRAHLDDAPWREGALGQLVRALFRGK
jgi:Zn-finger nucleic acid-binding protein